MRNIHLNRLVVASIIIFTFCFPSLTEANTRQNLHQVHTFEKDIHFKPHPARQLVYTNEYLQKISEAAGKLRVYTTYRIKTNIYSSIVSINNEKIRIIITLQKPVIAGEKKYYDFSLKNHLIPDIYSGNIIVENNIRKRLFSYNFFIDDATSFPLTVIDTTVAVTDFDKEIKARIRSVEKEYSEKHYYGFMEYISMLDDYYEAVTSLKKSKEVLEKIYPYNLESLILDEFMLCEVESIIGDIDNKNFFTIESIAGNDVKNVLENFDKVREKTIDIRKKFNKAISSIDNRYYEMAKEEMDSGRVNNAAELLNRALRYNRFHVPSLIQAGKIELLNNNVDSALSLSNHILNNIYPAGEWLNKSLVYTQTVYDSAMVNISLLLNDERFPEAKRELDKLNSFCNISYPFECDERLIMKAIETRLGVYNSFISVAQRALDIGNLSFCEMYASSALEYKEENSEYIGSKREAENLFYNILKEYINKGNSKRDLASYSKSLHYYNNAKRLCNKYDFLNCPDNFYSDIEFYAGLAAKEAIESKTFQISDTVMSPVYDVYGVSREKQKKEVYEDIKEMLSHGHLMAWAGEIKEAKYVLNKSIIKSEEFSFYEDTLIYSRINNLKERIKEKECELGARYIKSSFFNVQRMLRYSEYINAIDTLDKIKDTIVKLEHCDFDFREDIRKYERYQPAAKYQYVLRSASRIINRESQHRFESFFQRYYRAEKIWKENELYELGVSHKPLLDFMINSSNIELRIQGIKYFSQKPEPHNALKVLNSLDKSGISAKSARDIQEFAGREAARYYKRVTPDANARRLTRELTGGNSWFRYYNRAFRREW